MVKIAVEKFQTMLAGNIQVHDGLYVADGLDVAQGSIL
jgi:hypothetical protein